MQLITSCSSEELKPCVATIGFFDGVHAGHRFLLNQVRNVAEQLQFATALVTFRIHPRKVMNAVYRPMLLTTPEEKNELLTQTGMDYCIMLEFTPELSKLSAREFMTFLRNHYRVMCLVIGYDHRFGHNRSEGFEDYCRYGKELGIQVIQASVYTDHESNVSSSVVRSALQKGEVELAAQCLGYPYFIQGTVVEGWQNGRKIGFPTANIRVDNADKLIPMNGVYAVYAEVGGVRYPGMLNIGVRPTFHNGNDLSMEVHIFDFDRSIYQEPIRVTFCKFIRPEQLFCRVEELVEQLHRDAETVRSILL